MHVYRDGVLIVKWDLGHALAMKGMPTDRVLRLIEVLQVEGKL